MKASLQSRINPMVPRNEKTFNDLPTNQPSKATDSNPEQKTSFKDLILQSNQAIKEERTAKKSNDYSDLSEEEFFKRLSEDTKPKREAKNKLDKNDFLKLFVAQLQHQDPLNPDDGAEMASKLAQFNSLEQMVNTNTNLNKLIDGQTTAANRSLISYIGKDIKIDGGRIKIEGGKVDLPHFDLTQDSAQTILEVRDANGVKVAESELGFLAKGSHEAKWTGMGLSGKPIPDGTYSYKIQARTIDDKPIDVPLQTSTKITGVDLKNSEKALYTAYGKIMMEEVAAIGNTGFLKGQNQLQTQSPSPSLEGDSKNNPNPTVDRDVTPKQPQPPIISQGLKTQKDDTLMTQPEKNTPPLKNVKGGQLGSLL
jgi:flagellar basal-body rod modification protein FlgD